MKLAGGGAGAPGREVRLARLLAVDASSVAASRCIYLAPAPLTSQTSFTNGTSRRMATTKQSFEGELCSNNAGSPVYATVTNLAVLNNGSNPDIVTNIAGNVFVAKTPEQFGYDPDGNLTSDGRWAYTWDAENRLVSMQALSTISAGAKLKLDFTYDWQGRRIQKKVYTWNSGSWLLASDSRFTYDGWNLIATLNSEPSILQSFVWGLDLSSSPQGAGGVGGLLMVYDSAKRFVHFAAHDGNGNVAALVNAVYGTVSAQYEYGPFGELLRATGPMAKSNPFRFSTKYQDDETDMLYYGYRYYNPTTGRWLNRDPVREMGLERLRRRSGRRARAEEGNAYCFAYDNPLTRTDRLGLDVNTVSTVTAPPGACPCKCGPNVDDLVTQIFADIDKAWDRLEYDEKDTACSNLLLPPVAIDAWDMDGITKGVPVPISSPLCKPCAERLTFRGGCYDVGELNYFNVWPPVQPVR